MNKKKREEVLLPRNNATNQKADGIIYCCRKETFSKASRYRYFFTHLCNNLIFDLGIFLSLKS